MARKRRRFRSQFKARVALEALRERESVKAIATRHSGRKQHHRGLRRTSDIHLIFALGLSKRVGPPQYELRWGYLPLAS